MGALLTGVAAAPLFLKHSQEMYLEHKQVTFVLKRLYGKYIIPNRLYFLLFIFCCFLPKVIHS